MPDPVRDRRDPYVVRHPSDETSERETSDGSRASIGLSDESPVRDGNGPEDRPPPHQRPPGPEAVRHARNLALLAAIAMATAIAVPLAGVALGVVSLVLAVRRRPFARFARLRWSPRVVSAVGGVFALVVGGTLSLLSLVLGDETGQLRECMAGANTRVAEQICQDEFMDSLQRRLTGQ